jgi:hypothetical protein
VRHKTALKVTESASSSLLPGHRGSLSIDSLLVDACWRFAQIPHQAEPRETLEDIVGDIDLPPVEALSLRARVAVMVVMPTLSEGE